MLCPNCRYDNFEGDDRCDHCGADLSTTDVPQALADYHVTILGDHLDALGIGSPTLVEPGMAVAGAIALMHENGADCLLVTESGRLVGIFTDRDAAVKAVDKRLGLYRIRDFMTADPVVLRREDTLAVAIHKMAVGGFRHIPVVDHGKPIGVVSAADVFRHLVASLG
jgi:signal-transduction protein with cAMP-binding, CBS, and nucleotidyltransferase domain